MKRCWILHSYCDIKFHELGHKAILEGKKKRKKIYFNLLYIQDKELDEILGLEGLEDPEICKVCNRPLANWYTDCYHEHGDFGVPNLDGH